MRLFEKTKPLETEVEQLRLKVKTLESADKSQSKELLDLQEVCSRALEKRKNVVIIGVNLEILKHQNSDITKLKKMFDASYIIFTI